MLDFVDSNLLFVTKYMYLEPWIADILPSEP